MFKSLGYYTDVSVELASSGVMVCTQRGVKILRIKEKGKVASAHGSKPYRRNEGVAPFILNLGTIIVGYAVAQLVEALCYKPKGCGSDSRLCHWNLSLT